MARVIRSFPSDPLSGRRTGPVRTRPHRRPLDPGDDVQAARALEPMPDGDDITALFEWVGYDPDRAKAALVAEHDRESVRIEVLEHLSTVGTRESTP